MIAGHIVRIMGTKNTKPRSRVMRIGHRKVKALGVKPLALGDLYHLGLTVSWPKFVLAFAVVFLVLNTLFACLYALGTDAIANMRPGHWADYFYFSVETLATVGYGDMHPRTDYAHIISGIEIFTGMSVITLVTGLTFTRFSRPRARILFAKVMVVGQHDGRRTLMVRMANQRHNMITDANAKLWLTRFESSKEGSRFRRIHELHIERSQNPMFALSWTLFHPITESSPLWGCSLEELTEAEASFVLTFTGLDETTSQQMNARNAYLLEDVQWDHQYVDILTSVDDGMTQIDYTRFHHTRKETP